MENHLISLTRCIPVALHYFTPAVLNFSVSRFYKVLLQLYTHEVYD